MFWEWEWAADLVRSVHVKIDKTSSDMAPSNHGQSMKFNMKKWVTLNQSYLSFEVTPVVTANGSKKYWILDYPLANSCQQDVYRWGMLTDLMQDFLILCHFSISVWIN